MPDEQGQGSEQGPVTILCTALVGLLDAAGTGRHMGSRSWPEHSKSLFAFLNYH